MQLRLVGFICACCLALVAASRSWKAPALADDTTRFQYFPHVTADFCGPFHDAFDNSTPGWFTGDFDGLHAELTDGEYRLAFTGRGAVWLVPGPMCHRSTYRAAVDARWVGATGNFIGLLIDIDDDAERAYLFAVNTDDRVWLIFEVEDGRLNTVIPPTGHDAVLPGLSVNRLVAERIEDVIILTINDIPVGELRDTGLGAPVIAGVAAASYTFQSTADARFDNFLWEAEK